MSLSTISTGLLNTSSHSDSTTTLHILFQGLTMLSVKKLVLMSKLKPFWHNLGHLPLILLHVTWENIGTLNPTLLSCLSYLWGKTQLQFKRTGKAEQQHSQHLAEGAVCCVGTGLGNTSATWLVCSRTGATFLGDTSWESRAILHVAGKAAPQCFFAVCTLRAAE